MLPHFLGSCYPTPKLSYTLRVETDPVQTQIDSAERVVWSRSTLFTTRPAAFIISKMDVQILGPVY